MKFETFLLSMGLVISTLVPFVSFGNMFNSLYSKNCFILLVLLPFLLIKCNLTLGCFFRKLVLFFLSQSPQSPIERKSTSISGKDSK